MVMLTPESELEFRRRWYEAHVKRWDVSSSPHKYFPKEYQTAPHAAEGLEILEELLRTRNLDRFKERTVDWSAHRMKSFNYFQGQMFINQLVNHEADPEGLAAVLPEALSSPRDRAEAFQKIRLVADFVTSIKVGSHPAPGNVPFLLSFFWSLADWPGPTAWPSAVSFVEFCTGRTLPKLPSDRYQVFEGLVQELDKDPAKYEAVAGWWDTQKPVLLDGVLVDRCQFGLDRGGVVRGRRPSEIDLNAQALMGIARYVGNCLQDTISEQAGINLKVVLPSRYWKKGRPRADLLVDWRVPYDGGESLPKSGGPGVRLWINHRGMTICITPGIGPIDRYGGQGTEKKWYDTAAEVVRRSAGEGLELINCGGARYGEDHGFFGRAGSFVYGKWYEGDQLAGLDLRTACQTLVSELQPVFDGWLDGYVGSEPQTDSGAGSTPAGLEVPVQVGESGLPPVDPEIIATLAEDLLMKAENLDEVIDLLEDKGQVILYGPPGTGKTYAAKRIAEALAPHSAQRTLVQFHPSMSYEDFFEGYRPYEAAGTLTYRLASGPLRTIAERAASARDLRHIMVIDEINRANLPRVLGELLFLLEYRDEQVLPLYRPDKPFQLPPNLWFIGTMNTADRSIAHVDAALRRRFHFVPFFPNIGPMQGLLDRWLKANNESAWVGEIVALVNDELTEALGGPHLQLGASNFMKQGIGDHETGKLEIIWKYTIEPFIEEQLFDDPEQIERFRYQKVLKRYRAQLDQSAAGELT